MNPGYREESVTLLSLQKELSTISHKWFQVGVHFQIPLRTLNAIKRIVDENDELCMMRVCEEWVWKEGDPTWSAVVRMLESKVISEKALANSLKDKYCTELQLPDEEPPSSPKLDTSTTWVGAIYLYIQIFFDRLTQTTVHAYLRHCTITLTLVLILNFG